MATPERRREGMSIVAVMQLVVETPGSVRSPEVLSALKRAGICAQVDMPPIREKATTNTTMREQVAAAGIASSPPGRRNHHRPFAGEHLRMATNSNEQRKRFKR
jgi:hypothetical protein